eukprot:CAMPEP_0119311854 /NCGR_PEP_ID=MMETSP1333-20130426/24209_1 /TAXON_ID=418940 /ORGANISM="Scyphosphaera apsteinii, Strain RCC1455" /LENGTH=193 /DNA_ID=CAMNT_0007316345 /DNA_START=92 /DNA_END=673 /DNA_ORIENTATION=+
MIGKSKLLQLSVDIGNEGSIQIVTNATNVTEGVHVVVALPGCEVNGEKVKKAMVGSVQSEGMLCDAPMLGWKGGGAGAAALVPPSFCAGSTPPAERPRLDGDRQAAASSSIPPQQVEPLFEKKTKLSKEEKKAAAAAKKAEREAKKAAKVDQTQGFDAVAGGENAHNKAETEVLSASVDQMQITKDHERHENE